MKFQPYISIIIPTKNRPKDLNLCLFGLLQQSSDAQFEILIVDDHSLPTYSLEYQRVLAKFQELNCHFFQLPLGKNGAAHARNLAFKKSKGEIIAFLDDDAIPDNDWIKIIHQTFEIAPDIDAITGRITPSDPNHPLSAFRQMFYDERYRMLAQKETTITIKRNFGIKCPDSTIRLANNLSGGNSAIRHSSIPTSNLFNENFVMMHDKELTIRLLKAQKCCAYISDLKIQHKHTKSFRDATIKSFRSGKYQFLLEKLHSDIVRKQTIDLGAPLQKLRSSSSQRHHLDIYRIRLLFYTFLFEYLHQLGYLIARYDAFHQRVKQTIYKWK